MRQVEKAISLGAPKGGSIVLSINGGGRPIVRGIVGHPIVAVFVVHSINACTNNNI